MAGDPLANNLVALLKQEKRRKIPDEELLPAVLNPTISMNDQNCKKKRVNKYRRSIPSFNLDHFLPES